MNAKEKLIEMVGEEKAKELIEQTKNADIRNVDIDMQRLTEILEAIYQRRNCNVIHQ